MTQSSLAGILSLLAWYGKQHTTVRAEHDEVWFDGPPPGLMLQMDQDRMKGFGARFMEDEGAWRVTT